MKIKTTAVAGIVAATVFCGCISAERQAEYASWRQSDDGISTVSLVEFEAKHKEGWRERAAEKKAKRIKRERRQAEYSRWLASDDKVDGVSLEVFEKKHKDGWEARAEQKKQIRLAREEKERREAKQRAEEEELKRKRDEFLDAMAKADLGAIRKAYSEGKRYGHTYASHSLRIKLAKAEKGTDEYEKIEREIEKHKKSDWLKEWVEPRMGISEEDKLVGEALLAEFGTKHMPNAHANYEKVKDAAKEIQQIFNEEFPQPWAMKKTNPKWAAFNRVLERFARTRTEYFLCHDELCHYWIYYRLGVLTAEDFARIDSKKIAPRLLPENIECHEYAFVQRLPAKKEDADFAAKYAPESFALHQRLEQEFNQSAALIEEVSRQRIALDFVRFNRAWHNLISLRNDLCRELNALAVDFQTWHTDHRTMGKTSEDVAKIDGERSRGLKTFADSISTYVKERTLGRVIPAADMIELPDGRLEFKLSGEISRWLNEFAKAPWNRVRDVLLNNRVGNEELFEQCGYKYNKKKDAMKASKDDERLYGKIKHYQSNAASFSFKSLRIQRMQVTQMQWMIVMGTNTTNHIKPDHPVRGIAYDDAVEFIKRVSEMDGVSYRLPSNFELGYASREDDRMRAAREERNKWREDKRYRAVGLYEANKVGLYDMWENVHELCKSGEWECYFGEGDTNDMAVINLLQCARTRIYFGYGYRAWGRGFSYIRRDTRGSMISGDGGIGIRVAASE